MSNHINKTLVSVHLMDIFPNGKGRCSAFYKHAFGGCWGEPMKFESMESFRELQRLLEEGAQFSEAALKECWDEKLGKEKKLPMEGMLE